MTSTPVQAVRLLRSAFGAWLWLTCGAAACSFPEYGFPSTPSTAVSCSDRQIDNDESDYDCGGSCTPCVTGQACLVPSDCLSGVCTEGACAAPKCDDGVRNGNESDSDCGETCSPSRCPSGGTCRFNADCLSFVCGSSHRCSEAKCNDGLKNGDESDIDCGGSNCGKCANGLDCAVDGDCANAICEAGRCVPPACRNQALDPGETDIDCGGTECGPCAAERSCLVGSDCQSGSCTASRCGTASCADEVLNQDETGVDCGGESCPGCGAGEACKSGLDCESQVCAQESCAAPRCNDFTQNGSETGVDCGGGCPGCATSLGCKVAADCASSVCTSGSCQAPRCDDKVQNGSESDVDCGTGCTLCDIGRRCLAAGDCSSTACLNGKCAPPVHAAVANGRLEASSNTIQPYVRLTNDGKTAIPLHELSARYYYSKEPTGSEGYSCYWMSLGDCSMLAQLRFADSSSKASNADRYVELSFTSNAPPLGSTQSEEIHLGFFVPSYADFTQTNDYSFSASADFVTSQRVTVYRNGILIWGVEP